jgi:hypothetical protein
MEEFRKRSANDRPAALEAKYDPKEEGKEAEAAAFLGGKVEEVLENLRKGRTLEAGERAMEGASDMSINSPERVSNYI